MIFLSLNTDSFSSSLVWCSSTCLVFDHITEVSCPETTSVGHDSFFSALHYLLYHDAQQKKLFFFLFDSFKLQLESSPTVGIATLCWALESMHHSFLHKCSGSSFLSLSCGVGQQGNEHVWDGPHAEGWLERPLQPGFYVLWQLLIALHAKGLSLSDWFCRCLVMSG